MQQLPIVSATNPPIRFGFDGGLRNLSTLSDVSLGNDLVVHDQRAARAKQTQAAGIGTESSPARQARHGRFDTASNRDALSSSDITDDTRAE